MSGRAEPRRGPGLAARSRRLSFDYLESRLLLAIDAVSTTLPTGAVLNSAQVAAIKSGSLATTNQALYELAQEYQAYAATPGNVEFRSSWSRTYSVHGTSVDVYVQTSADATQLSQTLASRGWSVGPIDSTKGILVVTTPIARLDELASLSQVRSIQPIDRAISRTQGVADNQGFQTMRADVLQQQTGFRGTGQTIGVISDSVSRVAGGLIDSIRTGDLPSNVRVLQEGPSGSKDEGRAMLELIHDIAPSANLAFSSALVGGQVGFAQAIDALRTVAGATVLVDDISYFLEPQFQPGVIDQAIDRAAKANVPYFSAVGNTFANGYEAPLRFVPSGPFVDQDWDPGSGVDTKLSITVSGGDDLYFQWDNPYDGVNAQVTADVDIEVRTPSGLLVDQGVTNNRAVGGIPVEVVTIPSAGTYDITVRYSSGSVMPTRIKFYSFFSLGLSSVEYVAADQYQTGSTGHPSGPSSIAVGAVPFFNAPPFSSVTPILSQPYSSLGLHTYLFDSSGNRLLEPLVMQKPDISAIDGVNTSFFGNDTVRDADTLPNFFGTSAAAPNAAAVAALMKQSLPTATVAQIKAALIASARPLNGAVSGQWDPVGGYGLIDAVVAMSRLTTGFSPEIDVSIVGHAIAAGDITPSTVDGTDFGTVLTTFGQATRTIVITNVGTATLNLSASTPVQIGSVTPGEFTLLSPPALRVIPPGGSTSFVVGFTPITNGLRTGAVTINSDDTNEGTYTFSIAGTGSSTVLAPEIDIQGGSGVTILDGSSLATTNNGTDFGSASLRGVVTRDFTIINRGTTPLTLTNNPRVMIDGVQASSFTVVQQPAVPTLGPGGSATFRIAFSPNVVGNYRAFVHVLSDDSNEASYDFVVQGVGAPPGVFGDMWNDGDHNGVLDVGEPLINGLRVFLDANNNLLYDVGEAISTVVNGGYSFTNVKHGLYNVMVYTAATYYVTSPPSGYFTIAYVGGTLVAGSFGVCVNTSPNLDISGDTTLAANENSLNFSGTSIPALLATSAGGAPITDVDTRNSQGIAIVAADTNQGFWQYSLDGGVRWEGMGAVGPTSARLLLVNDATRIRFVPVPDFAGELPTGLSFRAWDGTAGATGDLLSFISGGGSSSLSDQVETVRVTVAASNAYPTVTVPGRQGARPDSTITFLPAAFNAITVGDIDSPTLSVSLLASHGSLRLGNTTGLTSVTGNLSNNVVMTGSSLNLNRALLGLQFVANPGYTGDASLLVIATDDGLGGSFPLAASAVISISLRNAFSLEGTTLYVTGTSANDRATVQYIASNRVSATLNGVTRVYNRSAASQIIVSLGSGNDVASVYGGKEVEAVAMATQSVLMTATGRRLEVGGANKNYVFGSADDTATMRDTTGDDQFFGLPTTSTLQSITTHNQVVGFGKVYAYASSLADKSTLYDSPGNDSFYAYEAFTAIKGTGFYIQAFGFGSQAGYARSGNDYAELRDSIGDDTVASKLNQVTLTTATGRTANAYGFDRTSVVASQGTDRATMLDSTGDDGFVATPTYSTMTLGKIIQSVYGFDSVDAYSINGGKDLGRLHDSAERDTLSANSKQVTLSSRKYANSLHSFAFVYVNATSTGDTGTLIDSSGDDRLTATGKSATIWYGSRFIALSGFAGVNVVSNSGGQDLLFLRARTFNIVYFGAWLVQ
jgi:hypothetical protein